LITIDSADPAEHHAACGEGFESAEESIISAE
jgi:hypothetical protein